MARSLDELTEFEEFRQNISKKIREDLQSGLSPEELMEKYQSMVVARQISIALADPNSNVAHRAIQDIRNRAEGTPTAKDDGTDKYKKLAQNNPEQFDSLLHSKMLEFEKLKAGKTKNGKKH